jgi:hypothetical protein
MIPKLVMIDKDLDTTDKALYALLCSYAGNSTEAYPSVSRICGDLNIHKDTFYRHLKNLIKKDYIRKKKNLDENKKFANNIYEIVIFPIPNFTETAFTETDSMETNSIIFKSNSINSNSILTLIRDDDTQIDVFKTVYTLKFDRMYRKTKRTSFNNETIKELDTVELIEYTDKFFDLMVDKYGSKAINKCTVEYMDKSFDRLMR